MKYSQSLTPLEKSVLVSISQELDKLPDKSIGEKYRPDTLFYKTLTNLIEARQEKTYQEKCKRNEKASVRRRELQTLCEPLIVKWAQKNLKVGQRVWFKGTKDGKGLRVIRSLDQFPTIVGEQFRQHRYWNSNTKKLTVRIEPTYLTTTNDASKIRAVEIDGKETSILDLILDLME